MLHHILRLFCVVATTLEVQSASAVCQIRAHRPRPDASTLVRRSSVSSRRTRVRLAVHRRLVPSLSSNSNHHEDSPLLLLRPPLRQSLQRLNTEEEGKNTSSRDRARFATTCRARGLRGFQPHSHTRVLPTLPARPALACLKRPSMHAQRAYFFASIQLKCPEQLQKVTITYTATATYTTCSHCHAIILALTPPDHHTRARVSIMSTTSRTSSCKGRVMPSHTSGTPHMGEAPPRCLTRVPERRPCDFLECRPSFEQVVPNRIDIA